MEKNNRIMSLDSAIDVPGDGKDLFVVPCGDDLKTAMFQ
jgi:hypothetical protein